MTSYNITTIIDVSNPLDVLGVFNLYSFGLFTTLLIIVAIIITGMWLSREQFSFSKTALISLASYLIPAVILRSIDKLGSPLIPDWYIALHLVLLAISAWAVWSEKTS